MRFLNFEKSLVFVETNIELVWTCDLGLQVAPGIMTLGSAAGSKGVNRDYVAVFLDQRTLCFFFQLSVIASVVAKP